MTTDVVVRSAPRLRVLWDPFDLVCLVFGARTSSHVRPVLAIECRRGPRCPVWAFVMLCYVMLLSLSGVGLEGWTTKVITSLSPLSGLALLEALPRVIANASGKLKDALPLLTCQVEQQGSIDNKENNCTRAAQPMAQPTHQQPF